VTGAQATARDAFADFVMNQRHRLAFGDGRYVERSLALPQGQLASARRSTRKCYVRPEVNQFARRISVHRPGR